MSEKARLEGEEKRRTENEVTAEDAPTVMVTMTSTGRRRRAAAAAKAMDEDAIESLSKRV